MTVDPPSSVFFNHFIGQLQLTSLLQLHRDILTGSKDEQGKMTELGFLHLRYTSHEEFLRYESYFKWREGVAAVGEKTPYYSGHPLVPYNARYLLGSQVKLIYTIREPVSATISLYLFRQLLDKGVDFVTWASENLKILQTIVSCREENFMKIELDSHEEKSISLIDIYNSSLFDWQATASIERSLQVKCPTLEKHGIDVFSMYQHLDNMMRWSHAFGKQNLLCIADDQQIFEDPQLLLDQLSSFLNVDQSGWPVPTIPLKKDDFRTMTTMTIQERLISSQSKLLGVNLEDLRRVLKELHYFYNTKPTSYFNMPTITDFCEAYTEREYLHWDNETFVNDLWKKLI